MADEVLCRSCGREYPRERKLLGYATCLQCGERDAKSRNHTIVPLHKSHYAVVTERRLLKCLNKYEA